LKLDLLKYLRLMRDLQLMPSFASQDWSYVYLQRFHGNCTIVPKLFWNDYTKIITNPSQERMDLYIRKGEQRTWPKLSMLMNRMKVIIDYISYPTRQANDTRSKKPSSTLSRLCLLRSRANLLRSDLYQPLHQATPHIRTERRYWSQTTMRKTRNKCDIQTSNDRTRIWKRHSGIYVDIIY